MADEDRTCPRCGKPTERRWIMDAVNPTEDVQVVACVDRAKCGYREPEAHQKEDVCGFCDGWCW